MDQRKYATYDRPFVFLLWKNFSDTQEQSSLLRKKHLKGVRIPDTVILKKETEYFKKAEFKVDWFFYASKSRQILKRHHYNANIIALQNFFLKSQSELSRATNQSALQETTKTQEMQNLQLSLVVNYKHIVSLGHQQNALNFQRLSSTDFTGPKNYPHEIGTSMNGQQFLELTHSLLSQQERHQDYENYHMLQTYCLANMDCLYEVYAEDLFDKYGANQLDLAQLKNNLYSFHFGTRRYSDLFALNDQTKQTIFQQYLAKEIAGAGVVPNSHEQNQKVDWFLEQTLTESLKAHLQELSQKVLSFITDSFFRVQSARLLWIIQKQPGEDPNSFVPSEAMLIDVQNIVFRPQDGRPVTRITKQLKTNVAKGKNIRSRAQGWHSKSMKAVYNNPPTSKMADLLLQEYTQPKPSSRGPPKELHPSQVQLNNSPESTGVNPILRGENEVKSNSDIDAEEEQFMVRSRFQVKDSASRLLESPLKIHPSKQQKQKFQRLGSAKLNPVAFYGSNHDRTSDQLIIENYEDDLSPLNTSIGGHFQNLRKMKSKRPKTANDKLRKKDQTQQGQQISQMSSDTKRSPSWDWKYSKHRTKTKKPTTELSFNNSEIGEIQELDEVNEKNSSHSGIDSAEEKKLVEFDSEALLLKTIKLKEELQMKVKQEENREEQKVQMVRDKINKAETDREQMLLSIQEEKDYIAHLKEEGLSYSREIDHYEKLLEDDREFFQLNIERVKVHGEPPVDKLLFMDKEGDEEGVRIYKYRPNIKNYDLFDEQPVVHIKVPPNQLRREDRVGRVSGISNSQAYFKAMQQYNNQLTQLKGQSKYIQDAMKDVRNYQKKLKKILKIEYEQRLEMLEFIYQVAYPNTKATSSAQKVFSLPGVSKDFSKVCDMRNAKIEKAINAVYTLNPKKVADIDPKNLDGILKMK